jgi:hypothetical protein
MAVSCSSSTITFINTTISADRLVQGFTKGHLALAWVGVRGDKKDAELISIPTDHTKSQTQKFLRSY